jgi:hypothetical protein
MEDPVYRKEMGFFILAEEKIRLCEFNKFIATSWRKTTTHGSRRTTHGVKRHVMETINKRLQIAGRAATRLLLNSTKMVFLSSLFRDLLFPPLLRFGAI